MPEKSPSRNDVLRRPTLSSFIDRTYFIKIDCQLCRVKRLYLPADLIPLCGDITVERIPKKFRCERCDTKQYLRADLVSPSAAEMVGLRVRKLMEIKHIRKPIWKDVKL